jgi:chromosome segregation ATPase
METIYYLSEVRWKRETLFAHARYVEKSKDFRLMFGDKDEVLKSARIAMEKRKNANAGFSLVFAIPNDLEGEKLREFAEKTKSILSETLNTDYIWIGYHDSISVVGNQNKHFHIIVANMDRNGKALRVNLQAIKSFRAGLQNLIESYGYSIRRDEHSIGHIGYVPFKDEEVRQSYKEYLNSKKEVEKQMEEEVVRYERKLEEIGNEIQGIKERIRDNGTDDRGEEAKTSTIRDGFKNLRRRIQNDYNSNRWTETRIQPTPSKDRETQNYFNSIWQLSSQKPWEIRRWDTEDTERFWNQWKQKIEVIKKLFKEKQIKIEKIQNAIEQEQGEIRAINTILRQNLQEIQDIRTRQQEPDTDNQRPKPRWGI